MSDRTSSSVIVPSARGAMITRTASPQRAFRHAHDRGLGNVGTLRAHFLDLERLDVLAAGDDQEQEAYPNRVKGV